MKKRILLTLPFLFFAAKLYSYKSEDLEKLQNTGACAKCDLSGANFYEADLQEVNLNGAILHHANLKKIKLERGRFEQCHAV